MARALKRFVIFINVLGLSPILIAGLFAGGFDE
jgi:hypothetical protein